MKLIILRGAPVIAVIATVALMAGAGGAVAGSLITSAQIKDNTIQSVDVKTQSNPRAAVRDCQTITLRPGPSPDRRTMTARGLRRTRKYLLREAPVALVPRSVHRGQSESSAGDQSPRPCAPQVECPGSRTGSRPPPQAP